MKNERRITEGSRGNGQAPRDLHNGSSRKTTGEEIVKEATQKVSQSPGLSFQPERPCWVNSTEDEKDQVFASVKFCTQDRRVRARRREGGGWKATRRCLRGGGFQPGIHMYLPVLGVAAGSEDSPGILATPPVPLPLHGPGRDQVAAGDLEPKALPEGVGGEGGGPDSVGGSSSAREVRKAQAWGH